MKRVRPTSRRAVARSLRPANLSSGTFPVGSPAPPSHDVDDAELARLRALAAHDILDTLREPAFDELAALASELCEAPIAVVSLVDRERQWFKATVGLRLAQTPRDEAFCAYTIQDPSILTVSDATTDPRFAGFGIVREGGVRFYAGAPLSTRDGHRLGALCVMDRVPRGLSPFQRRALETLAKQVEAQLELRLRMIQLADRESELRAQRDRMERVQRENEDLTALAIHDLKNPLASILPNARFIVEQARDLADATGAAEDIILASESMLRLVVNLLDLARAEEGRLPVDRVEVDVAALMDRLRAQTLRRAREREAEVTFEAPGSLRVLADEDLLRRALENLLDNAFKYTPRRARVHVSARDEGGRVTLRVADDGAGIPVEERARVFEKYARLGSHAQATGSRGLGLAFCKKVAEAHGGAIEVEANLPTGSVFLLRLARA